MERLPGVDAGFLYMETPALHMHTLKIGLLDTGGLSGDEAFRRLHEELGRRLHLLPSFRRRLVTVPFGLNHPVWIEDPGFDLAAHLRRRTVPSPGTRREMDDVIGDIAGTPLDRRRPLWQIWLLDGLADGRIGIVAKIHHALADGLAAAAMLASVMDTDPAAEPVQPGPWRPEPEPSAEQLVRDAIRDWREVLRALPALLADTVARLRELVRVRRVAGTSPPRPILDVPRASFNRALTPRRVFASTSLSLADIGTVRRAADVSVTDVMLAVVAGALRQWLAARGEFLPRPLVAGVPVGTDIGSARLSGNRVSTLITSLCTDIDDPLARLHAIHAVTDEAKTVQRALGLDMLERWVQFTPPGPFAGFMRLYSRWQLANRHAPPLNLVVSSVPGPREPLFVDGTRLADLYSVGPILEGIGLNVTAWSYLDRMNVAAIACPDSLLELRQLVDAFPAALDELVSATSTHSTRKVPRGA